MVRLVHTIPMLDGGLIGAKTRLEGIGGGFSLSSFAKLVKGTLRQTISYRTHLRTGGGAVKSGFVRGDEYLPR